jgi:RNA polymerase sigma-70 factor, ECF subfamily
LLEISPGDVQRLLPKLTANFRRQGVSTDEAKDLAQETLLRAHKGLARFNRDSSFDTWVISIAKHVWLEHRRGQGRQKRAAEEIPLDQLSTPPEAQVDLAEHLEVREVLKQVRHAVERLPTLMRHALVMSSILGLKQRTIAAVLQTSENQVASLIFQARAKIKKEVRD